MSGLAAARQAQAEGSVSEERANRDSLSRQHFPSSSTSQPRTPLSLNAPPWHPSSIPLPCRLPLHRNAWRALQGSSAHHLQQVVDGYLTSGYPVPFRRMPAPFFLESRPINNPQHLDWLNNIELPRLLRLGAITEVPRHSLQHCSPSFIVTKRHSSKLRLVIDQRHINTHLEIPHVKFEGLRNVQSLVRSTDVFFSLDVSDAYLHLPLKQEHRRLLAFNINGRCFQVNTLTFGMAASPSAWHKTMALVINHLRVQFGLRVVWLLDDVLFLCDNEEHARHTATAVQQLFRSLGLQWNEQKSSFAPTRKITFLGMQIDTTTSTPTFSATKDTYDDIRQFANNLLDCAARQRQRVPVRTLASLAGKVMSVSLAFAPARLLTREFYNIIASATTNSHRPVTQRWSSWTTLTPRAIEDLRTLACLLPAQLVRPAFLPSFLKAVRLFTDASSSGWGATVSLANGSHLTVSGPWLSRTFRQRHHITIKETASAALALHAFAPQLANQRVLLLCDNAATVHILNSGTSRNSTIMEHVRQVYDFCARHNIILRARWISTHINPADGPSRQFDKHAWSLSTTAFELIRQRLGSPVVDLFASADNHLLPTFCTFHPCPQALATDAFTLDWSLFPLSIAVPPFHVVQRVLQHIVECASRTIVVVPYWPSRPWFNDLLRLSTWHQRLLLPPGSCRPQPLAHRRHLPEIWTHWGITLLAVLVDCSPQQPLRFPRQPMLAMPFHH